MDLFDKLNAGLEPLGGALLVDAFAAARRTRHAHLAAAGPRAARKRTPEPEPEPPVVAEPEPAPAESMAGLQNEVEAYLTRDQIEGTDDAEVQEFLKERSGFDPTSI